MKKKILLVCLTLFVVLAAIFFYNYRNDRKRIRWQVKSGAARPLVQEAGRSKPGDIVYLNEMYRSFDTLQAEALRLDSFVVDLATISVMSGASERSGGVLNVRGKEIVLGLWGIDRLKAIDRLELDMKNYQDIIIDTFVVSRADSIWAKTREFLRQVLADRYGAFAHQVDINRQDHFVPVSINLGNRRLTKGWPSRGVVIKIKNRQQREVSLKLKGVSFHAGIAGNLRTFPSLSYFKHDGEWLKSLFLPPNSKISYTILASQPMLVDGYLGAFEKQPVSYRLFLNGESALAKRISGDLAYFRLEAIPRQGKITFAMETSGDKAAIGVIGDVTFYRPQSGRRNIVFYLVDALRSDFGGVEQVLSKEKFQQGAYFPNAYANATNTANSLPVIFSGKYKFMLVTYQKDIPFLPNREFLLAEYLKSKGYTTAAFITNPWLVQSNSHQGFDHLYYCGGNIDTLPLFPSRKEYIGFKYGKMWEFFQDFVATNRDKPLFIYIHTVEPHTPYELPEELRHHSRAVDVKILESIHGKFNKHLDRPTKEQVAALKALYKDEVVQAHDFFNQISDFLEEHRIIDSDSLLIFTADHGERFFEHHSWTHGTPDMYNEVIRIPLLLKGTVIPPGVYPGNVQLADIYPTIMHWLGDQPMKGMVGDSLLEYMRGSQKDFSQRPIYSDGAVRKIQYSFIKGTIKVILDGDDVEVYDLEKDPGETVNLHKEERFAALIAEARTFRSKFKAAAKQGRRTMSAEERKRLKSLGYID